MKQLEIGKRVIVGEIRGGLVCYINKGCVERAQAIEKKKKKKKSAMQVYKSKEKK
jgi:hypothetical protein